MPALASFVWRDTCVALKRHRKQSISVCFDALMDTIVLQYGVEPAVELWNTAWPDLVTAACKESELEVVTYMLMSLAQCVAGTVAMLTNTVLAFAS